ncbi:hypothetical protein L226DRAFT_614642 [Lentinus tigrinus ALCF2SS1-7]|uniref:Uncharacterized protein n=1 Tax=Lentinus tigrinus ALCF2SS1-6 TaxID=1328759 RepID=A0A5C2S4L1_9APHY|nr:hypothetical protein L227DRAFT_654663 [Lentinus tigrinus ALCF2SS1-6]RPD72769.1 hypothetical protein L226DRAFT_614642 [Lentinus tigrinus ALCF2SS1-7]
MVKSGGPPGPFALQLVGQRVLDRADGCSELVIIDNACGTGIVTYHIYETSPIAKAKRLCLRSGRHVSVTASIAHHLSLYHGRTNNDHPPPGHRGGYFRIVGDTPLGGEGFNNHLITHKLTQRKQDLSISPHALRDLSTTYGLARVPSHLLFPSIFAITPRKLVDRKLASLDVVARFAAFVFHSNLEPVEKGPRDSRIDKVSFSSDGSTYSSRIVKLVSDFFIGKGSINPYEAARTVLLSRLSSSLLTSQDGS